VGQPGNGIGKEHPCFPECRGRVMDVSGPNQMRLWLSVARDRAKHQAKPLTGDSKRALCDRGRSQRLSTVMDGGACAQTAGERRNETVDKARGRARFRLIGVEELGSTRCREAAAGPGLSAFGMRGEQDSSFPSFDARRRLIGGSEGTRGAHRDRAPSVLQRAVPPTTWGSAIGRGETRGTKYCDDR
jgi:hypothetical protein